MAAKKDGGRHRRLERLLRNWKELEAYAENAVSSLSDAPLTDAELLKMISDPWWNPDFEAASIARRRELTLIIVSHVRKQLGEWADSGGKSGMLRVKIIQGLYFDEVRTSLKEISAVTKIPIWRLGRELSAAKDELEIRIFGAPQSKKQRKDPAF
jgi:hypothetical protein